MSSVPRENAGASYERWKLPTNGRVELVVRFADVLPDRHRSGLVFRLKARRLPDNQPVEIREDWEFICAALIEGDLLSSAEVSDITLERFPPGVPFLSLALRAQVIAVGVRTTADGVRMVSVAARAVSTDGALTLRRRAQELASAVDAGVRELAPVLARHRIPLTDAGAIAAGRLLLTKRSVA